MPEKKWEDSIDGKRLRPESLMMGYGYRPEWSEGSIKSPIFQTSTFVFESAEEGKAFFELALGKREPEPGEQPGLIYSRLNNPDLEILEDRLTLWDDAEAAAAFASGMAAIATTLLAYLRPGDVLLHSLPLYGGTDHLVNHVMTEFGIELLQFFGYDTRAEIDAIIDEAGARDRVKMILIETPANPTNTLTDIALCAEVARDLSTPDRRVLVAVDNTFLGPVFQHPLHHGADVVLYSATKFIGGHSDLIAGAALGSHEVMGPIRAMRTFLGTMVSPYVGWLMMRSLETLHLRMTRQVETAGRIAEYLAAHPKVTAVHYLGGIEPGTRQHDIYQRQCLAPGAMIAFELPDGEAGSFRFLNALKLAHLAVSLGGTETLAQHPASMTHSEMCDDDMRKAGVAPGLVRLSIGVEHPEDLILDLAQALEQV